MNMVKCGVNRFKKKSVCLEKYASPGNRTRIYCLEGNNANLYTTDAVRGIEFPKVR